MFELFKQKAQAVSSEVIEVQSRQQALEEIKNIILQETDARLDLAVWAIGKRFTREEILDSIGQVCFDLNKDNVAPAIVGITEADFGIAETGTLAIDSTNADIRLASSLVSIHIAILCEKEILAQMKDVLSKLNPNTSAYVAFITGPSRTADIERVLTIGVHGPERLIIIVLKGGCE